MLAGWFALRYFFSKKSHSVINLIAGVSVVSVAVPVAAMIVLLSVFNGFEQLVRSMNSHFDADLSLTPLPGPLPQPRCGGFPAWRRCRWRSNRARSWSTAVVRRW